MYDRRGLDSRLFLCVAALAFVVGCVEDQADRPSACEWVYDPADCEESVDGEDAPKYCETENGEQPRTVYQCNGSFEVKISFETIRGNCAKTLGDPDRCNESHEFGVDTEPYAMPAVMACCDAAGTPEAVVSSHCGADLVEQICLTVPRRLQKLIDDRVVRVGRRQVKSLRKWLSANRRECYDALYRPGQVPGTLEPATWLVNDGENGDWSMIDDFTISVGSASIDGAWLPDAESDQISCVDNDYNNAKAFEDIVDLFGDILFARS